MEFIAPSWSKRLAVSPLYPMVLVTGELFGPAAEIVGREGLFRRHEDCWRCARLIGVFCGEFSRGVKSVEEKGDRRPGILGDCLGSKGR